MLFNNENASYRKRYTSYYTPKVALTGGYSFAKDGQFHLSDF